MKESELKDKLTKCAEDKMDFKPSDWSIAHRGACMQVSVLVNYQPDRLRSMISYFIAQILFR